MSDSSDSSKSSAYRHTPKTPDPTKVTYPVPQAVLDLFFAFSRNVQSKYDPEVARNFYDDRVIQLPLSNRDLSTWLVCNEKLYFDSAKCDRRKGMDVVGKFQKVLMENSELRLGSAASRGLMSSEHREQMKRELKEELRGELKEELKGELEADIEVRLTARLQAELKGDETASNTVERHGTSKSNDHRSGRDRDADQGDEQHSRGGDRKDQLYTRSLRDSGFM